MSALAKRAAPSSRSITMGLASFGQCGKTLRLACAIAVLSLAPDSIAEPLPLVELVINGHRAMAEVALTNETRTIGLMNRFSLQPDHGMLFVFSEPQPLAFWMRNTYVPLSIAFIGENGRILNIEDMAPQTQTTHPSRGAALYALEMKKGWFAEKGVGPGMKVDGLDRAPKAAE